MHYVLLLQYSLATMCLECIQAMHIPANKQINRAEIQIFLLNNLHPEWAVYEQVTLDDNN